MIDKTTLSQFPLLTDFEKQWAFKESKKEPNVSCDTLPLNLPFPNPLPKHSLSPWKPLDLFSSCLIWTNNDKLKWFTLFGSFTYTHTNLSTFNKTSMIHPTVHDLPFILYPPSLPYHPSIPSQLPYHPSKLPYNPRNCSYSLCILPYTFEPIMLNSSCFHFFTIIP